MTDENAGTPPGWYYAAGDPPGTQRYWDGAQWQGGPQPVAAGPGAMAGTAANELAGPGQRLLARIVDILILIIPLGIVVAVFGQANFVGGLVTFLLAGAYEVYFLGTRGATIGKSVMNIKVVTEEYADIDYEVAVRRYAINILQVIPGVGQFLSGIVGLATIVMIFVDKRRQVPWDKIAKTVVVKA